jgi:enediyne biosynthesis protein E4
VTTSVGYAGSSEPEAHFGLGRSATVRRLEIDWPSGAHQVLEDLAADRRIIIEEPQ